MTTNSSDWRKHKGPVVTLTSQPLTASLYPSVAYQLVPLKYAPRAWDLLQNSEAAAETIMFMMEKVVMSRKLTNMILSRPSLPFASPG